MKVKLQNGRGVFIFGSRRVRRECHHLSRLAQQYALLLESSWRQAIFYQGNVDGSPQPVSLSLD